MKTCGERFAHRVLFGSEREVAAAYEDLLEDIVAEAKEAARLTLRRYMEAKESHEAARRKAEDLRKTLNALMVKHRPEKDVP